MKKIIKLALAILLIALPVFTYAQTTTNYYPEPTGYVTDTVNLLTPEQRQNLETYLENFEKQTSNEIAVLIVKTTYPEEIEEYSIHVTDRWKIGKKDLDNGVLFTIALDDHRTRLEVGQGLEGVLTDITATKILEQITQPKFRDNQFYEGITETVQTVAQIAQGEFDIQSLGQEKKDNPLTVLMGILFYGMPFILSFFASWFAKSKSIHAGGITGGVIGGIIALIAGLTWAWIIGTIVGATIVGLIFDYIVSNGKGGRGGGGGFWWGGGGRSGGGGGFGGFGGGGFSGGGGSGRW